MKALSAFLRPGFALCLFLSQFTSLRASFFSESPFLIVLGIIIFLAGVALIFAASGHLRRSKSEGKIASSGPYHYIRHPIYVSVYLICAGMGLLFFVWAWFLVMLVFAPLWWLESREEEKQMQAKFGEQYTEYQNRTKMFIPGMI